MKETKRLTRPRIIFIKGVNGDVLRNPLAGYDTTNAACSDLSSKYWKARSARGHSRPRS